MKSFVTILAASAVLTASLCAGLAANATGTPPSDAKSAATIQAVPAPVASPAWVEPPAKADMACRDAAWPYRSTVCAVKADRTGTEASGRRVRIIPTGAAPANVALL